MKIFVVLESLWDGDEIAGIFRNRRDAEFMLKQMSEPDKCSVEEHELID